MSYILEAIKKLEQKRQQEESPSILTLSGGVMQVDKKRLLWPYVTAGAILLNGVTALALLWYVPPAAHTVGAETGARVHARQGPRSAAARSSDRASRANECNSARSGRTRKTSGPESRCVPCRGARTPITRKTGQGGVRHAAKVNSACTAERQRSRNAQPSGRPQEKPPGPENDSPFLRRSRRLPFRDHQ